MTSVEFDFSEIDALAVEIEGAAPAVGKNVEKALGIAALKGKRTWAVQAKRKSRKGHLKAYPYSVDYDNVKVVSSGVLETAVGPNLDRNQGALGIVEDAPGGVRGTPQRNRDEVEKVVEADLVKGILLAVGDDGLGGP